MQQQQRHRIGADAGDMQIVQVDIFKRYAELRKSVQRGFLGAPIEFGAPIFREFTQIRDVSAVSPRFAGRRIRKARPGKTLAEVGNVGIRDMQREWNGLDCHAWLGGCWTEAVSRNPGHTSSGGVTSK